MSVGLAGRGSLLRQRPRLRGSKLRIREVAVSVELGEAFKLAGGGSSARRRGLRGSDRVRSRACLHPHLKATVRARNVRGCG